MINQWSYNRLKTYEECPYRAFLAYVEKHEEPKNEYAERGIRIHEQIEAFIKGERKEPPDELSEEGLAVVDEIATYYGMGIVHTEEQWAFTRDWKPTGWFDKDCWVRVVPDARLEAANASPLLIDWKTGRKGANAMVSNTLQMQLYAIAYFQMFPEKTECETQIHYVCNKAQPLTKRFTREQAMLYLPRWTARAEAMCADEEFQARPNIYNCKYCSFSQNNLDICRFSVEF